MIREILLLGNPRLYQESRPVENGELEYIKAVVHDLHDTLMDFRNKYGIGRAIAAPQIGILKRLIYMHLKEPVVFINPELTYLDDEYMEVWDDCMSFPDLIVKVKRHKNCRLTYKDKDWNDQEAYLTGDLSELIQHEYDHLDGILATMRAIDSRSYCFKSQRNSVLGG